MMDDGRPPSPEAEIETQPGVDVNYVFSVDEKRSLSFRTMFAQATPPGVQERILGRIIAVGAIAALKEKLIEFRKDQANAARRLAELVDPKRLAEIQVEIDALNVQTIERLNAMEAAHQISGRQGEFRPVGREKAEIEGIRKDVDKLEHERNDLRNELVRQRTELEGAIGNWAVAIANAEAEIEVRRASYGE